VTGAEATQYALDTELLGERVAYWFVRERQGFSALDEIAYWECLGKVTPRHHDPVWSPFEAA
jgi:hypothetical protein